MRVPLNMASQVKVYFENGQRTLVDVRAYEVDRATIPALLSLMDGRGDILAVFQEWCYFVIEAQKCDEQG